MAIQQLTQPILNPIAAFDATQAQAITFVVIGGAQVIGNRLVISDNQTGAEVYNQLQSTMKLEHLVPANTLANGGYYNAVVYTIDSGNNESEASTAIPFYCYSQPSLTIDNIPATETIENGTYKFTGNYLQQENELLNSYQYTLYDSNRDILSQSPLIYYNTDPTLSYTFVGMSNDTSYYIELSGETINGTKITSGLRYFTVRYIQPASFAICDLVNNCENGYIQISSNIVAIDGKSNPDPPIYIDDKEVDLRDPDSWVEWNSGFRIQDDFTMRVWGRDFNDYQNIITLTNDINTTSTPNRIELKWMVGDVIKTLPSYTTVEGTNINILNAEAAKIQNLSVGGNSIQKERNKNLLDFSKLVTANEWQCKATVSNEVVNITSNASSGVAFVEYNNNLILDTNKTYTISANISGSFSAFRIHYLTSAQYSDFSTSGDNFFTFKPLDSVVRLMFYVQVGQNCSLSNIQVEEGSIATSYEPFGRMPSPTFPSEVYSVGETKNLINIENFNANYTQQYFQTTNTRFLLKPNFIYTFSFDYNVKATTTDLYYSIGYGTDSYDTDLKSTVQYQTLVKGRNSVSFIIPDSIPSNSYLWVKFAQTIILADVNVDISNIQLEAGNVATDYEDPGLYNIYPTSAANNLFNYDTPIYLLKNNINYVVIQNGYHISPVEINKEAYLGIGFKNILKPGNTYTLSFSQLGQFEEFALYTTNKESEETIAEIPITNNVFVAPEGIYDLQLVFAVDNSSLSNYIEIWNVQIEANNVISEYEPYVSNSSIITLDEPLRGIGEYKDLICLESPNILNQDTQSGVVTGNTIYYLNQTGNIEYYIWYYNEDGNLITFIDEEGHESSGTKGVTGSFVTHKDCVKITITKSDNPKAGDVTSSELTTNHVGITKGINPQVYYPYISEPSIVRYIKGKVFDGTENITYWGKYGDHQLFYYDFLSDANYKDNDRVVTICNQYKSVANNNDAINAMKNYEMRVRSSDGRLYWQDDRYNNVNDMKAWMADNNVILYYVLSTPSVSKLSDDNISALKALSTYKPVSNIFTNNEVLGNIKLDYVSDYTEQQTENAYVLLKCWNANIMPYVCHSNYIDIPDEKDKVFIWMRRKNNLFDLKIENLGDYNEDDKPTDTTKPIVTLEINPNNVEANRIPVTAYSIDDNGLKTVRFSKDNGNSWDEIVTVDGLSSTNSYTFINLNPNTTYTIRVEAIDLAGNIGGISQQVTTKS